MNKAEELLAKLDGEILDKVNAIVMQNDAEIKANAQAAYDAKVEEEIAKIKEGVEAEYKVAREYLLQVIEAEKPVEVEPVMEAPIEEAPVEEVKPEEPVVSADDSNNGPEVL